MVRSKAERSGLVFPVTRIWRYMKRHYSFRRRRILATASVYLTAVMEYLTREVTELAGELTIKSKRKLLTPRNIMLAIANDEELQQSFRSIVLPFSGVVPRVNKAVLTTGKQSKRSPRIPAVQRSMANGAQRATRRTTQSQPAHSSVKPLATLSQRTIARKTTLYVLQGNVTHFKGDVVIHPTDRSMGFHGQVGAALLRAGGQSLLSVVQDSYAEHGVMEPDGVRLTRAAGLCCPYIIHCDSPGYNSSDPEQSVRRLEQLIEKCLKLCDEHNLREVILPSVGSGNSHYPKQLAAETILRTIKTYCDAHFETTVLVSVKFVLYDNESINVYQAELARLV